MQTSRVPLEVLQVQAPCPRDWDAMRGDGGGGSAARFCDGCRKHVYDLSAMPREAAERLVCERAGDLCVRFGRDEAGTVVTLDYQRPKRPRRGWRFWSVVGAAGAVAAGCANYLLLRPKPLAVPAVVAPVIPPQVPMVMGVPCPLPPPPTTQKARPQPPPPAAQGDPADTPGMAEARS